ncbi:MAG: LacI family DNA-binding transcriptional regulator [Mycetocola sp.]
MAENRPTLAEVARIAEVSVATASKVVNRRSDVSPTTRSRVLAAIQQTGYRSPVDREAPSPAPVIVALLAGIDTMYSATVLHGIVNGAAAHGVDVVVRFDLRDLAEGAGTSAPQNSGLPAGCIGFVAVTFGMRGLRLFNSRTSLPIVVIDPSEPQEDSWMTIGSTNWMGARAATDHLLELGHSRIGWIGGPGESGPSIERLHGYRAALQSAGIPLDATVETEGQFTLEYGRQTAIELLRLADPPTAFVAANDEIAIGAIQGAKSLGLEVPFDVSIVGFDDTPQAEWATPKLTSVRQPLADMGLMAVRLILDSSSGATPESRHIQLATRLMVRDSTSARTPLAKRAGDSQTGDQAPNPD